MGSGQNTENKQIRPGTGNDPDSMESHAGIIQIDIQAQKRNKNYSENKVWCWGKRCE